MLINLQPFAEPIAIDACVDGELRSAGRAWDCADKLVAMRRSLRVVEQLVAEGRFRLRDRAVWQFQMHYTTAEDWTEFLERPSQGQLAVDQALLDAAFARPDGSVTTTENDLACVYERVGA